MRCIVETAARTPVRLASEKYVIALGKKTMAPRQSLPMPVPVSTATNLSLSAIDAVLDPPKYSLYQLNTDLGIEQLVGLRA